MTIQTRPSMDRFGALFLRDFRKAAGRRMLLLMGFMVLFQSWFILTSDSAENIMETGRMEFMAIVFSFNFFGSLAALALTFDSISGERRNKVMDLILTSGVGKPLVMAGKITVNLAVALLFSGVYTAAIALLYILTGTGPAVIPLCARYLPALIAFIFLYCMLGFTLSILFRSAQVSFIISMVVGILCMPWLFTSIVEGIAKGLGLGSRSVELMSMASPACIMNALGGSSDITEVLLGLGFLVLYAGIMIFTGIRVFSKQDEMNYDE